MWKDSHGCLGQLVDDICCDAFFAFGAQLSLVHASYMLAVHHLCVRTKQMWHCCAGALFQDVLPVALLIPERLPRNKMLRARFISYLHRMVECLGPQVQPFLPQVLAALLPRDCDTVDMTTALRLLNQLIAKFPQGLVAMLRELVPSVVVKCDLALASAAPCACARC